MIEDLGGSSTEAGRTAFDNIILLQADEEEAGKGSPLIKLLVHSQGEDVPLEWVHPDANL